MRRPARQWPRLLGVPLPAWALAWALGWLAIHFIRPDWFAALAGFALVFLVLLVFDDGNREEFWGSREPRHK